MAAGRKQRKSPPRHRPARQERVAEIIGRTAPPSANAPYYRSRFAVTTVDATVPDYAFYDLLRRGKQPGYRLGALFAKRIERVLAAWIFGEGINVTLNKDIAAELNEEAVEYTNAQLKNFVDGLLDSGQDNEGDDPDVDTQSGALLLDIFRDAIGLGDQYVVVNPDGSLSVPSPDTVEVVRDELDYRRIVALRITTKLEKVTIIDEYRADGRTVTIRRYDNGKPVDSVERFENLIGRIPFVHVAYGRSGNETNGHSIHEELLKLYDQYDDVVHKQLDGAKLLGNPILAFTGMENLAAVIDANKPVEPQQYVDMDGNEVTRPLLNVDSNSVMLIGKGGDGKFISPPVGFTEDTKTALKTLFLLLLEHLGIPESVWGGELSSARATSDTQLTQFVKELKGWQQENGGWVARLCKIWLQYRALTDPLIVVEKLTVDWPAPVEEDKELLLKFIQFADGRGLLKAETALKLLNLVDDPEEEVKAGQAEADARAEQEQQRAIAMAQATKPPPGTAVGEMHGTNGYNEGETSGLILGAIRREAEHILAGGD